MTDNIKVIVSADGTGYVKTLNTSANQMVKWARTVDTQSKKAAQGYVGELNKIENRLNGLNTKLNTGAGAIASYLSFNAIKSGTVALYDRISSIEDLRTQYAFLLGSETEAARQEEYLLSLSDKHKKSVADLAQQYSGLLVLRRSGLLTDQHATTVMEGMSNVQSATRASAEQLKQSMYGLSQALASPIVRAEELNQVVEPLPGLLNAMDEASGLGAGGMRNLVLEGKVTSAYFRDVLIKSFGEYEGAAVAMADTLSGTQASAARDYDLLVRKLEAPISSGMKSVLRGTSEALQFFTENAESTALLLGGALAGSIAFYTVKMGAAGVVTVAATLEKRNFIQASIAQAQQETVTAAIAVNAANAKVVALARQKAAALGSKAANQALVAAELEAAAATTAHKTAIDRLALAQRGATTAGRGLLTLLGGPLGLAFTALSVGTAFLTMGRDAETSTGGIDSVIDRLDRALGKMKKFELRGLRADLAVAEKQYQAHLTETLKAEKTRDYLKRRSSKREAIATQIALEKRQKLLELEERIAAVKAKVKTLEAPETSAKAPGQTSQIKTPVLENGGQDLTLLLQGIESANTAVYANETARIQAIYSQRHDMIIANTTATGDAREKALQKNTAKYLNEYQSATARDKAQRIRDKNELSKLESDLVLTANQKIEAAYKARNADIKRLTKEGSAQQSALMQGSFTKYKSDLDAQQRAISADQKAWADSITQFADPWAGAASSTAQIFGNISTIMKEGNKASFEESKKWASAQAIINGALAATRALAEGGPYLGPALAASIAGVTAVQIKKINEQEYTPAAHGGLDYVGAEQTYLLQQGERVLSPTQNRDLTSYLNSSGGGNNGGEFIFNLNFYSMDPRGAYQLFMDNKGAIANATLSEFKRRNISLKAA